MNSKDELKQKYLDMQSGQAILESILYITITLLDNQDSIVALIIINLIEIGRLIAYQPYFNRLILKISIFLQVYLFLFLATLYIMLKQVTNQNYIFSFFILIFLPISCKVSLQIEEKMHNDNIKKFEEKLQQNEPIGGEILNYVIRSTLFKTQQNEKQQNQSEIKNMAYLIKIHEILMNQYLKDMEQYYYQNQNQDKEYNNSPPNIDELMDQNDQNLLGEYEEDTIKKNGKEYIAKEQVFGKNIGMHKAVRNLFNDLFLKERNEKEFGIIDIYYLIYIVEILQNFQLFELTTIQMQKNTNLKHQQILSSIMQEVCVLKNTMKVTVNQNQIFNSSYYEAIIYDQLIQQTQQTLEKAVQKKVSLLLFMKQKHINLEELQEQLEELLNFRDQLINQISLMIRINEQSNQLYDIYINYLETLSFSESDIKLDKYNRYQNESVKIYYQMSTDEACILFTSLHNSKEMKITKTSNNIQSILGFEQQKIINNSIESLMPQPYAAVHKEFVTNFFQRGDVFSNLKDLTLFINTQSNHIIPVNIDIKVNIVDGNKDVGMTAYIQKNSNNYQYILFDASNSRIVSMTSEINQFIFSNLRNFNKASLTPFFPFITNFRMNYSNSSSIFSKNSQMTLNSIRTRQIASNMSVRSHQGEVNTNKSKFGQEQENKKKSIKQQKQKQLKEKEKKKNLDKNDKNVKQYQKQLKASEEKNEIYDENDERKYKNVSFFLVVNNNSNAYMTFKSKRETSLSDFQFFIMNLNLHSVETPGLDTLKYIEFTQIKQINPLYNVKLIQQIYNDEAEGYLTNLHNLRTQDSQVILTELESRGIKDSCRYTQKANGIIDEFQEDEHNSDEEKESQMLYSNVENQEIKFNRFLSQNQQTLIKEDSIIDNQNQNHHQHQSQEIDKSYPLTNSYDQQKSGNQSLADIAFLQKKDNQDEKKEIQQSMEQKIIEFKYRVSQYGNDISNTVNNTQLQEKSKFLEESTHQMLNNHHEISTNFDNINSNMNNLEAKVIIQESVKNPQKPFKENAKDDNSKYPLTLVSPTYDSAHDIRQGILQANFSMQENAKRSSVVNNQDQSTVNYPKIDLFSPKDLTSQQHLMLRGASNRQILSPQDKNAHALFSPQSMNQQQTMGIGIEASFSPKKEPQKMQSMSVHSLSRKRKKILAARKNEIKNLKDALDSSSNHSRESAASSTRKTTKSIILQKNTLGIMKIVNIVGFISFFIIIVVILQQYFQMNTQFDQYNKDLDFVNWSSSYEISLALVMKNYNLKLVLDSNMVLGTKDDLAAMAAQQNLDLFDAENDMQLLLQKISVASTDRQIVQKMLSQNYYYKLGSRMNRDIPLTYQTSADAIYSIKYQVSVYYGVNLLYAYMYRYVRGLGFGTAQYIAVVNSEAIIESLLNISKSCQQDSINQLSGIQGDLDNVLIIICLVTAFCIFIIIPVYSFIQTKREQIISLFGTFNSTYIDNCITEIQKIYARNNSIKSIQFQNQNNEDFKRQNLSSTTKLNRTNKIVLTMAIIIFILTLPYPILNKVLSSSYIDQNKDSLPMFGNIILKKIFLLPLNLDYFYVLISLIIMEYIFNNLFIFQQIETLQNVSAFIIEYTSLEFFCFKLKLAASGSLVYSNYIGPLMANVEKSSKIQNTLQQQLQVSRNSVVFDQNLYDNYFLKMFETQICRTVFGNPVSSQLSTFLSEDDCNQIYSGILNKGFSIAVKKYFSILNDLNAVIQEPDMQVFQQKFQDFQQENSLQQIVRFQQYLVDVLDSLSLFLRQENDNHKQYLSNVLLGLLLYQFIMMGLIFYFGWIIFYKNMDRFLYKTKLYLAVLNINYLIQNPYIQNYLHNNLS